MSAQDDLVAAVKTALLEAADQMSWVDLPDKGSEAVLDGRFDLPLLAASLHASGYRPAAGALEGNWETVRDSLDALPNASVIRWQSHDGPAVAIKRLGRWHEAGYHVTRTVESIARDNTPVEVIA